MGRHNLPKTPIDGRKALGALAALAIVVIAVGTVLLLLLTELEVI